MVKRDSSALSTHLQRSKRIKDIEIASIKPSGISFTDLPGKLRNKIYYVYFLDILRPHNEGEHACEVKKSSPCWKNFRGNSHIFFASRLIYKEAGTLFYAKLYPIYWFQFHNLRTLKAFLRSIGLKHRNFHGFFQVMEEIQSPGFMRFDASDGIPGPVRHTVFEAQAILTLISTVAGIPDAKALRGHLTSLDKSSKFKHGEGNLGAESEPYVLGTNGQGYCALFWGCMDCGNDSVVNLGITGSLGRLEWLDQIMMLKKPKMTEYDLYHLLFG